MFQLNFLQNVYLKDLVYLPRSSLLREVFFWSMLEKEKLLKKLMKERKGRKMVTAMYTILNGMECVGRYQRINLISFVGNLQHSSFYVTP